MNAAIAPNGAQYLQIKQSRRHTTPATILFPNTENNRRDLAKLFNQAHKLLNKAEEIGMEFSRLSMGCLGPQLNQPDCRDRGTAFYDGQMHLTVERNGIAIARFRAIESQYDRHRTEEVLIYNLPQLKKMQTAMDAAPLAFEQLQKKQAGWIAKTAI